MEVGDQLQYFLNVKRITTVVSFAGLVTFESTAHLNKCLGEIRALTGIRFVILNLQGIKELSATGVRPFSNFQAFLREDFEIFLCNISDPVQKVMSDEGIIRTYEVGADLMSVLQIIVKKGS